MIYIRLYLLLPMVVVLGWRVGGVRVGGPGIHAAGGDPTYLVINFLITELTGGLFLLAEFA
jgi:hypothetical protein